jgi:hypothetical protein
MKINIDEFRVHEPLILKQYAKDGLNSVSLYAATAMVPVIALLVFIREVYPSVELDKRINTLIGFYGYTEVLGERKA